MNAHPGNTAQLIFAAGLNTGGPHHVTNLKCGVLLDMFGGHRVHAAQQQRGEVPSGR